ncbi:hypothetical protein OROHE_001811 [Orobanche hederae]
MEWCVEIRVISFVVCFCFISITLLLSGFDANEEAIACDPLLTGDALIKFKDLLTDPRNATSTWDNSLFTPCGNWFHISCGDHNEGDKVTRINLGNQQLSGSLSPELGKLKHLEYLELYDNSLTGSIPPEFGNMSNLQSLDLYDNKLSGSIPIELGNLKYLKFLSVFLPWQPVSLQPIQILLQFK